MRTHGLVLLISLLAAPAALAEPRPLKLEEALRLARDGNRDLAAIREHLKQVAVDIDRAWAPLLPTVNAQGKYTHNNIEIPVDFTPQILSGIITGDSVAD